MLSTLFTEILNRDNWLILMDYILLNFKQTHIMLFLPVAILRLARVPLLHAGMISMSSMSMFQCMLNLHVYCMYELILVYCLCGLYYILLCMYTI